MGYTISVTKIFQHVLRETGASHLWQNLPPFANLIGAKASNLQRPKLNTSLRGPKIWARSESQYHPWPAVSPELLVAECLPQPGSQDMDTTPLQQAIFERISANFLVQIDWASGRQLQRQKFHLHTRQLMAHGKSLEGQTGQCDMVNFEAATALAIPTWEVSPAYGASPKVTMPPAWQSWHKPKSYQILTILTPTSTETKLFNTGQPKSNRIHKHRSWASIQYVFYLLFSVVLRDTGGRAVVPAPHNASTKRSRVLEPSRTCRGTTWEQWVSAKMSWHRCSEVKAKGRLSHRHIGWLKKHLAKRFMNDASSSKSNDSLVKRYGTWKQVSKTTS